MEREGCAALAAEMETALRRHVMDAWFPLCIDRERGGYLCDFDRQWRPNGPQDRMLEFQARQTRAAARMALAFPAEGQWAEYALHGFRYLRDVMWDSQGGGGWFWLMSADGAVRAGWTKHAHSGSYAVQACALVHAATGDASALELAEAGLDWFDRHAHDAEHGGFHSWLLRDGTVIRDVPQVPAGLEPVDPLDHAVGLKDVNVNGDWFEALLDLRTVSRQPLVMSRLRELAELYLERLTTPAGVVRSVFREDWRPESDPESHGYGFQATHRLLEAVPLFPDLPLAQRAGRIAAHTVRSSRRRGGGFAAEDWGGRPRWSPRAGITFRRRSWWVQLEAVRMFAYLATRPGTPTVREGYWRLLDRHWKFVCKRVFDERYGGAFGTVATDLVPWERPWFPGKGRYVGKGNTGKDASHDADSLLKAIELLRAGS